MIGKVSAKRVLAELRQTSWKKYVPSGPGISFGRALRVRRGGMKQKSSRRIKPGRCEPWRAHFRPEELESNLWARLLSGSPRMDGMSRLVLPSTLLLRVGINDCRLLGPVSALDQHLRGPRSYTSAACDELSNESVSKIFARYPEFRKLEKVPNFQESCREVLKNDIERCQKMYRPHGPRLCTLTNSGKRVSIDKAGILILNIANLGLPFKTPMEITLGVKGSGIRLAGTLYKLGYVHEKISEASVLK